MSPTSNVEATLQRHGYSTPPTLLENSCLAVYRHESNGTTFADVLVYRETNGRGETLKDEAALLVEALPRVCQQLRHQPDLLSPNAEAHVITFLGKRVPVLVGGDGRPLCCRLSPLLILSPTTASKGATRRDSTRLPSVPANELDQYMSHQRHVSGSSCRAIDAWLLHLRRSHQLLGAALLALFSVSGFSLLLASLGWVTAGVLTFIVTALSPLVLLLGALRHFRRFEHENPSGILIAPEFTSLALTDSLRDPAAQPDCHPSEISSRDEEEQSVSWTPSDTAAFLLDSMQGAMTASLSAYQAANWQAHAGYLNSLLVNGIRLAILKHTGQVAGPRTEEMLDQLSAITNRGELDAWLHRLATARQTHPLTTREAQEAAHFVVQTLRQLHVMPAPWEAQVLRTIPRPSHRSLSAGSPVELPLAKAAKLADPLASGNPLLEPENSTRSAATAALERPTVMSATPRATTAQQRLSVSPTPSTVDSEGAPLNVLSERDLDLLADMVRAGASPYLFVFGNRYLAHWKTLRQMIDETAQRMNSQVNVVVFPGLGDQKVDPKVVEFYHRFRVEGAANSSSLPLICALSRTVLLHILEDNLPVPSELVVDPNPERFLDRVRSVVATAQAYQVNLTELKDEEDSIGKPLPHEVHPNPDDVLSQSFTLPADSPSRAPAGSSSSVQPDQSLVMSVEDVVEEVDRVPASPQSWRVTELDVTEALRRRELATMVPVVFAVVHLPEHQHVVDALETAARQEEHLIAEYVDSTRYPDASEALHTEAGTVRLRYNGTERLLEAPKAEHLLISIRQLRATTEVNSHSNQSAETSPVVAVLDSAHDSKGRRRSKAGQPRRTIPTSTPVQSGG